MLDIDFGEVRLNVGRIIVEPDSSDDYTSAGMLKHRNDNDRAFIGTVVSFGTMEHFVGISIGDKISYRAATGIMDKHIVLERDVHFIV